MLRYANIPLHGTQRLHGTNQRHGAIVIPPELRESMSLEEGTTVTIQQEGDHLILRPVDPIDRLRGISKGAGAIRDKEHREDRFE